MAYKPGARTSQLFIKFVSKSGSDPKNFRGVSIDDLVFLEGINERNIFINDFDIQEREYVREIALRTIGNFEKPRNCLKIQNHIIYTYDFDSFFKRLRCDSSGCFLKRSDVFNEHLIRCKDRVQHIYLRNAYHLWIKLMLKTRQRLTRQ